MERRKFGNTGVEVSAISLGCWIFGVDWWGHYTDDRAVEICNFTYDQGITFFDNGDAYGNGRAEELFGKFLKTVDRSKIQVGGKFGYDFYSDPGEVGSHKRGPKNCPLFMNKGLDVKHMTGPQTFDASCRKQVSGKLRKELPALEALLEVFR